MELYFTVSGIGMVLHTLNPRLFLHTLSWIVAHAHDKVIYLYTHFLSHILTSYNIFPHKITYTHTHAHTHTGHLL